MAGRRIAQLALRPGVVDFIDAALAREGLEFAMEEVTVDEHLAGRTVRDLRQLGLFTLAVRHGPAQFEPAPVDERAFERGEWLILAGPVAAMRALGDQG